MRLSRGQGGDPEGAGRASPHRGPIAALWSPGQALLWPPLCVLPTPPRPLLNLYLQLRLQLAFQELQAPRPLLARVQAGALVDCELGQELVLLRPHPGGGNGCQCWPGARVSDPALTCPASCRSVTHGCERMTEIHSHTGPLATGWLPTEAVHSASYEISRAHFYGILRVAW